MESQIGWLLSRAAYGWRNAVDHYMAEIGLTQSRWMAMLHLDRLGEGCSQKELADTMGIEQPSILRTLNNLEEAGIVERRNCAQDARRKTLWFTVKGRELLEQVEDKAKAGRQHMLEGISLKERKELGVLLDKVISNSQHFLEAEKK
ncbi:MarR family transcriptional regulator [Alteromonas pelagimontana]|uniref:MarR family transcriptional regulator n=1 Tax=Alteromonas pelagimontana TaxID=1858656 RepID=A0A6M4MDG3_9ALTE|nr:MarR family transcriptional regulator [Alteromonas pelagimontana]QJR80670.1 MarR family transcriptional regulator [Alteromonas pelagimontana]